MVEKGGVIFIGRNKLTSLLGETIISLGGLYKDYLTI